MKKNVFNWSFIFLFSFAVSMGLMTSESFAAEKSAADLSRIEGKWRLDTSASSPYKDPAVIEMKADGSYVGYDAQGAVENKGHIVRTGESAGSMYNVHHDGKSGYVTNFYFPTTSNDFIIFPRNRGDRKYNKVK